MVKIGQLQVKVNLPWGKKNYFGTHCLGGSVGPRAKCHIYLHFLLPTVIKVNFLQYNLLTL